MHLNILFLSLNNLVNTWSNNMHQKCFLIIKVPYQGSTNVTIKPGQVINGWNVLFRKQSAETNRWSLMLMSTQQKYKLVVTMQKCAGQKVTRALSVMSHYASSFIGQKKAKGRKWAPESVHHLERNYIVWVHIIIDILGTNMAVN